MRITLFVSLITGCLLFSSLFAAENSLLPEDSWELKRDRNNIQVYTGKIPGSPFDAVRAATILEGVRISSIVALLMDSEACPDWADKCVESYVHEQISETELLVYTLNNLPFPVKDRDILSRVLWSQDPQTKEVVMISNAANGILDERRGKLRLTDAYVTWRFLPLINGSIQAINEAHIDPGSALPGWIVNMLLVDTPFETLKAFRLEVGNPKYQDAEYEFVTEP